MAYSTEAELKNNIKLLEKTFSAGDLTTFATDRIALADKIVKADCNRFIDFSSVPDDNTTPIVNLLSQYKAAEMSLRRIAGIKRRTNENDDITEWKRMYDDLKFQIANQEVDVLLADGTTSVSSGVGTFTNTARPTIRPNQGWDKYGEWINNDDMEEVRGDVDDDYYNWEN